MAFRRRLTRLTQARPGLSTRTLTATLAAITLVGPVLTGCSHHGGPAASPSTGAPVSPSTAPGPTGSPAAPLGADITGPLTVLLAGVDTRVSVPGWQPHSDAVLIMWLPRGLDHAYLFSLPRDLVVDIPAFAPADFAGQHTKLTHAMSYGSRVPGKPKSPNVRQGYDLLSKAVSRYTGIPRFDAGAVLTFTGMTRLVDALGGIDLTIDQKVVSIHRRPDGTMRTRVGSTYVGPQMVYQPGRRHLVGWQALDYARQRYTAGGDYTRQRHQQQLIRAIITKVLDGGLARDPDRLDQVVRALGKTLTYVDGGRRIVDFAGALSRLPTGAITLVDLPGHGVGSGAGYRGEALEPVGGQFLAALRAGRVESFLAAHPSLVSRR
ncbi:LCP family protein [Plantactinospora siamensis]|uniref:LCP family protein n=1 Tax=Plantactinospora siamensis TaxID=555372 RepID=A0ABV6NPV9_9ACTN